MILFPDAQLATLEVLRARIPDATFGTLPLNADDPSAPNRPYAAVRLDGSRPGVAGVDRTASIRVAVWHTSEAKALALAESALAALTAYEGGPKVRSFRERTGPIPTADPETGSPMAFFTVAARLRPSTQE